jgi:hypothetical protein
MAYQVNKTDGSIVATVADSQIDTLSTDLTLIGKNYSGFGESLNENFVKLLENFANTARPSNPIRGQLWFDTTELKLKIYSGTEFIPVSSATIANTQPLSLGIGDLWFNDVDKQLYFYDGSTTILLGPSYSAIQGISGFKTDSILDTLNQTRVITYLYNNGTLLGIFSNSSFTPKNAIIGFTGDINPGFNAGSLSDLRFNVPVLNSDSLGTDVTFPRGIPAEIYVRKDQSNAIDGQLRITKDEGVVIGSGEQLTISVNSGNVNISNTAPEQNMIFLVRTGATPEQAMIIRPTTRTIDLYPNSITSQVNVGGSLTVNGNLTVNGDTTVINTETLTIEDKVIQLANSPSPSDATADGGGIVLKGDTNHSIIWTADSAAWNSTEHINLDAGKEFKINGAPVITATSLGPGITSIPGVSSFGKQNVIRVGPGIATDLIQTHIKVESNTISTEQVNQDLQISPNGLGNVVLLGSPRITGLQNPQGQQDAATKEYVDNIVESRNLVFSIDLTDGKSNSYIITNILNGPDAARAGLAEDVATAIARNKTPLYRNGTTARILCTILSNASTSLNINPLISQTLTPGYVTTTGTAPALTNVAISTATITGSVISTQRIIKVFQIQAGIWVWQSDALLPP